MKHTVLILDDDPNIRMLLEYVLRKHFHTASRENGLEALAWLAENPLPDLILTDLEMPGLSGFELLQQLRISGYYRHIPLLVFSGFEDEQVKEKCLDAGANGYILKPFDPATIVSRINSILQYSKAA